MTVYACIPPCKACRESDTECPKLNVVQPAEDIMYTEPRGAWYPSATWLPCGCYGPPWPIFVGLGEHIQSIDCEVHGTIEYNREKWQKQRERETKKAAKKRKYPDEPPF